MRHGPTERILAIKVGDAFALRDICLCDTCATLISRALRQQPQITIHAATSRALSASGICGGVEPLNCINACTDDAVRLMEGCHDFRGLLVSRICHPGLGRSDRFLAGRRFERTAGDGGSR